MTAGRKRPERSFGVAKIALSTGLILGLFLAAGQGAAADSTGRRSAETPAAWALDRPVLPAPHAVVAELWRSTVETRMTSPRSLVFHAWVTFSATARNFSSLSVRCRSCRRR